MNRVSARWARVLQELGGGTLSEDDKDPKLWGLWGRSTEETTSRGLTPTRLPPFPDQDLVEPLKDQTWGSRDSWARLSAPQTSV